MDFHDEYYCSVFFELRKKDRKTRSASMCQFFWQLFRQKYHITSQNTGSNTTGCRTNRKLPVEELASFRLRIGRTRETVRSCSRVVNMLRVTLSTSCMRSMGFASGRRHCNNSAKQSKSSKKREDPAEFVKRRRIYGQDMHNLRVSFGSELAKSERRVRQAREVDRESLKGSAGARAARKR